METTVFNPQKGRNETLDVEFTKENTTWFDNCAEPDDIYMITDRKGGLLIQEFAYRYPFLIYHVTRADINYDQRKALEVLRMSLEML